MDQATPDTLQLPLGVVSKVDVGRLLREIDTLNTFMRSAEMRQPGQSVQLPKTSKLLDEFLEINKKSALKDTDRDEVERYLADLRSHAPSIHMSFSADPSPLFTQRLISWLRQNIHPNILLQIGLQPTIGAGTIVRTTNKYFDLSLREFFTKKKSVLLAKLRAAAEAQEAQQVAANPANDQQASSSDEQVSSHETTTAPTESATNEQTPQELQANPDQSAPEVTAPVTEDQQHQTAVQQPEQTHPTTEVTQ